MNRRLVYTVWFAALVAGAVLASRRGGADSTDAACFGTLNATPYASGFTAANFSSLNGATISAGTVQLNTALTPLDSQHIVLPFDQRVTVKYVYRNAGYSHSLGWFFFDQVQPFLDVNGKLADVDHDGVPDFFQAKSTYRPNDGLWRISSGTVPDLVASGSDGGNYPHIPNLLETFMTGNGGMIFKLCDDDTDLSVSIAGYPPVNDVTTTNDGIPDYDVNGDGIAGNEADRTVDLGIIPGGREIVLFAQVYGSTTLRSAGLGLATDAGPAPTVIKVNPPPGTSIGAASGDVLQMTAWTDGTIGDHYLEWSFAQSSYAFVSGDCVEYDYYIPSTACYAQVGDIDIRFSDTTLAKSLSGWPATTVDLTSGCGSWHHRQIPIPTGMIGKTSNYWNFALDNDTANTSFTVDIDNVVVKAGCGGATTHKSIYTSGSPGQNKIDVQSGYRMAISSTTSSISTVPYFTKNMLNPDFGAFTPNTVIRRTAIGCSRDDSTCYGAKKDAGGNAANLGWLDAATMTRLASSTMPYGQLNISGDPTVVDVTADSDGNVPHFVVFAPQSDPNRWLLAFDDQPAYSGSDYDYNDVAFLIERTNGGEVVSQLMSGDIPASQLANTVISRVHLNLTASYPSPGCDGVTNAEVRIYYSVDGQKTWRQVTFPALTGGDVTIDVLGSGDVGNQLYWKADFISSSQLCSPILQSLAIGYEAVENGEFKFSAPVPLSNVVYTGSLETPPFVSGEPAATANDYSLRGHFRATRMYDPANPSMTSLSTLWDGGAQVSLSTASPATRGVYTGIGGVSTALSTANGTALFPLVLSPTMRTQKYNSKPIYDFNGDGVADDNDARFVVEWTRGWEYPASVTFTPAQATTARGWRLGPVHSSSPAIVGPPPRPTWIDGSSAPASLIAASNTYRTANAQRLTRAIVGSQDGMVHAFDAGKFRWGNDTSCTVQLQRGCFAGTSDAERYGSGNEVWTYVPPSQLANLANLHPAARANAQSIGGKAAEVNGSIAVEDIWMPTTATFKTVAFASLGRNQPYISAIDVSTDVPAPLWTADFADTNFAGTELSPSIGLANVASAVRFGVFFTSGLATAAGDEYLYILDAPTGTSLKKIKLNSGTSTAQGTGMAGYPNLVDASSDGLIDRVYMVDTSGRVFKYDLSSQTSCVVASLGESVYSGMGIQVQAVGNSPAVKLFVGGGPNPDGSGTVASAYHFFSILDNDPVGTCSGTSQAVYTVTLGAGQKIWAAPFVGSDQVYYATASSTALSVCQTGAGAIYGLSLSGNGSGAPLGGVPTPVGVAGSPVSGIRVFDGHVLVNSVGGQSTILGSSTWNNKATGSSSSTGTNSIVTLPELSWEQL